MTLVEVAAALALLGGLLGATVLAKSRFNEQWRSAQRRLSAVAALDVQLNRWRQAPPPEDGAEARGERPVWPRRGEGPLDGPWWWRAEVLRLGDGLASPTLAVVRYTAFDPTHPRRRAEATLDVLVLPEATEETSDSDVPRDFNGDAV